MEEEKKNWIDAMIEREATPKPLREETTRDFCTKHGIPESTYYYEVNKKENWEKIEDLCFKQAKKHTPEILENLGERGKTDNKAAEIFLEFILERKKRMDITSNNESINTITDEQAERILKRRIAGIPESGAK